MSQDVAGELEEHGGLQELIQTHLGHDAHLICGELLCIWLSGGCLGLTCSGNASAQAGTCCSDRLRYGNAGWGEAAYTPATAGFCGAGDGPGCEGHTIAQLRSACELSGPRQAAVSPAGGQSQDAPISLPEFLAELAGGDAAGLDTAVLGQLGPARLIQPGRQHAGAVGADGEVLLKVLQHPSLLPAVAVVPCQQEASAQAAAGQAPSNGLPTPQAAVSFHPAAPCTLGAAVRFSPQALGDDLARRLVLFQVLQALQHLHAQGLWHGALSPDCVHLTHDRCASLLMRGRALLASWRPAITLWSPDCRGSWLLQLLAAGEACPTQSKAHQNCACPHKCSQGPCVGSCGLFIACGLHTLHTYI